MLGKLLKYDFKSMFRVFVPLWLALLAVSVINHFTTRSRSAVGVLGGLPQAVFMILYVGLVIAVMVVSIALIIMRFYSGLLKDEGYLMFTLPVRPWQLISSKCIVATVVSILSLIAAFLSVMLISAEVSFAAEFVRDFRQALPYITGEMVLAMVLTIVLIIAAVVTEITHIYASLALGHLANRHRIAWAVLVYIGINAVLSMLLVIFGNLANRYHWHFTLPAGHLVAFNFAVGVLILLCVIQIVVFFVITERILSKRLNLE